MADSSNPAAETALNDGGPPADFPGIDDTTNAEDIVELGEQLGTGASGTVHRGRIKATGEVVAVKVVPVGPIEVDRKALRDEIAMLSAADHPNVVSYYGTYWASGALWVVMECCSFGSIEKYYEATERPLPEAIIAYVCHEVLAGLDYLHRNRVMHRDVKGSNILITAQGGVKLADFGVSAQLQHTLSWRNSSIGTLHWMAPETIESRDYDERADIWSLGITAIEIADGHPPLFHLNQVRAMFEIPRTAPPKLRDNGEWTPALHRFIARCLVKDLNHRPRAADLLQDPFIRSAQNKAGELAELMRAAMDKQSAARNASSVGRRASHEGDVTTDDDGSVLIDGGGGGGGGDDGTADDDTMVERPSAGAAVGERHVSRVKIPPGVLVDLPVLSLDDFTLDELTEDDDAPAFDAAAAYLAAEEADVPSATAYVPRMAHATRVLLRSMHHHQTAAKQRALDETELERHERLFQQHRFALRASLATWHDDRTGDHHV